MTSFVIDTGADDAMRGAWRVNVAEIIMDSAEDRAGPNATPEDIAMQAVDLILRQLWDAKKPETVRSHFLKLWPIIAPMAHAAPDSFDKILTEYAERASLFR